MEDAQQAYDIDLRRVERALRFANDPNFHRLDGYQLRERITRFEEAFAGADRNHRILVAGQQDDNERQRLLNQFEELSDQVNDMLATYRRRMGELAQQFEQQGAPPAPPVNDNNAAPPVGDDNAQQVAGNNGQQAAAAAAAAEANAPGAQALPAQANLPPGMQINVNLPFQPHQVVQTWGKFNGNPLRWFDFKQRFRMAVHDVQGMPNTNKMAYLRDALTGEAAEAMQGYGIDPDHYIDFWNALVQKYEQRYTLACAHLSHFFGLKKLERRVGAADLRRLSNETNGLLRQLRELNYPVEHWNLIIVHALQERLSPAYAAKWQAVRNNNDEPTVAMITNFIDEQAGLLANQGLVYQPVQVVIQNE